MVGPDSTSFEVQYGRVVLGYVENGRELTMIGGWEDEDDSEGDPNTQWVVIDSSLHWCGCVEPLSEAETTRVLASIQIDMEKQGWNYVIHNWKDSTRGESYFTPAYFMRPHARIEYSIDAVRYSQGDRFLVLQSVCDPERKFRTIFQRQPLSWSKSDGTRSPLAPGELEAIKETIVKDMEKRKWEYKIEDHNGDASCSS